MRISEKSPEESLIYMRDAEDYSGFYSCFQDIIEVVYKWITRLGIGWRLQTKDQMMKVYQTCIKFLAFINNLIAKMRSSNLLSIEKELKYFDLLFAVYHITEAETILKKFRDCNDRSPHLERKFSSIIYDIKDNNHKNMDEDNLSSEPELSFVAVLLGAMQLTTARFYITETSAYMSSHFGSFVETVMSFSGVSLDLHKEASDHQESDQDNLFRRKSPVIYQGFENLTDKADNNLNNESFYLKFVSEMDSNAILQNKFYYALFPWIVKL